MAHWFDETYFLLQEEHREERKDINPYTVDTWTSDEDEDEDG